MLFLIIIISGAAIAVMVHRQGTNSTTQNPTTSSSSSIKAVCEATRYPNSCFSSISSKEGANKTSNPLEIFKISLQVAMNSLSNVSSWLNSYKSQTKDKNIMAALDDCQELFADAMDTLNDSLVSLQDFDVAKLSSSSSSSSLLISDLQTWLSAVVTYQETCIDGFEGDTRRTVEAAMVNSTQLTSNSLAIVAKVLRLLIENFGGFNLNRKLLQVDERRVVFEEMKLKPNVTVAKDGSGEFKSITKALELVPKKNMFPFVIYVKEGVYSEYVEVEKSMWNVTILGDGMYKTVVTGSKNKVAGSTTFKSATFIVSGRRFTAINMGFVNTAGPDKHQAVALRSSADQSVFYRCSFVGFQDTLYTHSLRQYYRECDIVGTVDFIFGDASVIFQNCRIMPRQPMQGQANTITAQGRIDPNENTGIVIQASTISPFDNVTADTYLGRPWKVYATTIFMRSVIGEMVDKLGWLEWEEYVVPPKTIDYAEYHNTGPGSSVAGRVNWPGYRPSITGNEAKKFGVDPFIQGSQWIPSTGISFDTIS
ncbi:pectinesterase 3-like [Dioscorea cayenensis subsp. rotundata]|uniref:Pectinesterase n=1 Tax=Dioscorea cayennensis subsp. rotundata TaxID=55577 RepID=A0AB40CZA0_DIOCR|nr:pectinesterase 3-like [Dioscorea cayenensis subsp. rotundata]